MNVWPEFIEYFGDTGYPRQVFNASGERAMY